MADELPVWRQAIHTKAHPLHQVAWLLFSESWSARLADRFPAEQRDDIIAFCYLLIDSEDLYMARSLGSGLAPCNAMRLLGHWHITAAIPRILDEMNEAAEAWVFEAGVDALSEMGTAAIEPVLEYAAELDPEDAESNIDVCEILSQAGKGDDRAYRFIQNFFESRASTDPVVTTLAQKLLRCDAARAIPYLESIIQHHDYKRYRSFIQPHIDQARRGEPL